MQNGSVSEAFEHSQLSGQTSEGGALQAVLLRLSRHVATVELHNSSLVVMSSEVFSDFKITLRGRTIYNGRAVVRTFVNTGLTTVCEVGLDEQSWLDLEFSEAIIANGKLQQDFEGFMQDWQRLYRVRPEYKVAIADMQSFLSELRPWLEQVELGIRSLPASDRLQVEKEATEQLAGVFVPVFSSLFERFESIAAQIESELQPAHSVFGKRQMHPLLLCSPFVYRTFHKPLGYAGDYEMVNMMFRDPYQGGSIFAKLINAYALQLPPIIAHRNRIAHLCNRLMIETRRVAREGRTARIFSLGCGPAHEVQQFLSQEMSCDESEFVLVDFNDETLAHTSSILEKSKRDYGHRSKIRLLKRSAQHFIKQSERQIEYPDADRFDIVYCAGLFDYIPDRICRKLMQILYGMLAPNGVLIATNVDVHTHHKEMEYFLEWHLIYRNTEQMTKLVPLEAGEDQVSLLRDTTGTNILMEIRKPKPQ